MLPASVAQGDGGVSLPFRVRSFEEVTSTNEMVKRALDDGETEGLVVRARRQTAGYGRQGRRWTSPEGGLYCSLLLRPQVAPTLLPTLSLVVGLAVRRALAGLASQAELARILVKWPNDVVAEAGKLCGISLEGHGGGVCAGVGVNVRPPAERPEVGGKNRAAYVADFADVCVSSSLRAAVRSVDARRVRIVGCRVRRAFESDGPCRRRRRSRGSDPRRWLCCAGRRAGSSCTARCVRRRDRRGFRRSPPCIFGVACLF